MNKLNTFIIIVFFFFFTINCYFYLTMQFNTEVTTITFYINSNIISVVYLLINLLIQVR